MKTNIIFDILLPSTFWGLTSSIQNALLNSVSVCAFSKRLGKEIAKPDTCADLASLLALTVAGITLKEVDESVGLSGFNALMLQYMKEAFKFGADPNFEKESDILLFQAIRKGHPHLVECIVEHGANVNDEREYCLPLGMALTRNDDATVEVLLKRGANPNQGDPSAWFVALDPDSTRFLPSLFECGANIDTLGFDHLTALHWCASHMDPFSRKTFEEVFSILLDQGINVNVLDKIGQTAHQLAILQEQTAVASVIGEYLANQNASMLTQATNEASYPFARISRI